MCKDSAEVRVTLSYDVLRAIIAIFQCLNQTSALSTWESLFATFP